MAKKRRTLNVSPEFLERMRKLQGKIMAENGKEVSLTDLSNELIKLDIFSEVETRLLNKKVGILKWD